MPTLLRIGRIGSGLLSIPLVADRKKRVAFPLTFLFPVFFNNVIPLLTLSGVNAIEECSSFKGFVK